jgi:hypothetical protein
MKTIKKAQMGKDVPKGYVRGEMTGKLIKKKDFDKQQDQMAAELDKASVFGKKKDSSKAKPPMKKKAETGTSIKPSLRSGQYKRIGRLAAKNEDRAKRVASRMVERDTRKARGKQYVSSKLSELMPKSKSGSKVKKCKYGCK